jgi:NitT/TauT family transport system ATP-binding protein
MRRLRPGGYTLYRIATSFSSPGAVRLDFVRIACSLQTIQERSSGIPYYLPMTDSTIISQNVANQTASAIELRNVTKRFQTPKGEPYTALRDLNLNVAPGEFCAVVGPTGCGKSTTLGLISGLERPSVGEVQVMGKTVQGIDRRIGYVFQSDAIFPWKNVLRNVATGPLFRGRPKAKAVERARDWIARVGLAGFEDRYPHQLSGGMRKRVALAQTFINEPQILLMDEPFSALDVQTRTMMEDELLNLWSSTSASVVFVTHDLEEAISLADRVCVLTAGPATVKGIYTIDLPRPRKVAEIRFEPRFVQLYHEIWEDLRNEVLISYERTKQRGQ